jgi:GntR family transcriptional regulator
MVAKYNIQPDMPAYVYETMADHIAARIESGELKPNEPLTAERKLAEDYGVSLGTARRATEELRRRGLVFTLRCTGTYVLDPSKRPQQLGDGATVHSITAAQEYRGSGAVPASAKPRSLNGGQNRGEVHG